VTKAQRHLAKSLAGAKKLLPLEEDREEARHTARRDSFSEGPEMMARRRLETLRTKKRVAQTGGPRLTAAQETMFRFLTLLYPSAPRPSPSKDVIEAHPFSTEWPYPYIVGNRDSSTSSVAGF
jgi:hypothetical protein